MWLRILFSLILFIASGPAFANAGVPMIFLSFPAMLALLLPIVFLEAFLLSRYLNSPYKKSLTASFTANLLSTVVGFPIAWLLLFALELLTTGGSCGPGFDTLGKSILTVILESAWLCPWEKELHWLIPVAFINSLIVAFFLSIFIEYKVVMSFFKEHPGPVKKSVLVANILSYSLLFLISFSYIAISVKNA